MDKKKSIPIGEFIEKCCTLNDLIAWEVSDFNIIAVKQKIMDLFPAARFYLDNLVGIHEIDATGSFFIFLIVTTIDYINRTDKNMLNVFYIESADVWKWSYGSKVSGLSFDNPHMPGMQLLTMLSVYMKQGRQIRC